MCESYENEEFFVLAGQNVKTVTDDKINSWYIVPTEQPKRKCPEKLLFLQYGNVFWSMHLENCWIGRQASRQASREADR